MCIRLFLVIKSPGFLIQEILSQFIFFSRPPSPYAYELFTGFKNAYKQLPKKSSTAKAIAYALNIEVALRKFLSDGNVEIDNNAAERALRSVAVGRKNWLFAGSDEGGKTASIIYTILETAKLNNVNPVKYLHKVFDVIQDYKANHLQDLLPWNIKLE